ncbi:MAG: AzlC family ABC transporter permease [Pseudomonadota bacterium]
MVSRLDPEARALKAKVRLSLDGVRRGAVRLMPMGAFTIPFGIAFGVAAIEAGMSVPQAIAMSVFAFSGAAQFAALDFWPSPIALGSLAMVVLALNARHVIMGAALSPWVDRLPPWHRIVALSFLSDPNFADSQPAFRAGERDVGILLGGGLALWSAWVAGTVLGVSGGAILAEPERMGIDVVMACFFVAVVVAQVRGDRTYLVPIVSASAASIATLGWLPTGWNVILGAFVGAFVGCVRCDA